jgi:16S rRNA (guanine527-N7)-methyltransferase
VKRIRELVEEYDLPPSRVQQFERLLTALASEPDPHTTISDPVDKHLADSLSALRVDGVREAASLVDIGAGAGFPGLPLAIALPDTHVDLVEATQRKAAVIERLADGAGIANARAVARRVEEWAAAEGGAAYDVATARAVAPLPVLVEYAAPLLKVGGRFVAWKGSRDPGEEAAGAEAAEIVRLRPIQVARVRPFAGARDLNLHLYLKERKTPDRFPRRPGAAAKRPLA